MQLSLFENYQLKDFTTHNMIMVEPDENLSEIYTAMKKNQIRHIPVVENGEAVGVISDRDIKFVSYYPDGGQLRARDVMTINPYTVPEGTSIREVVDRMGRKKISSTLIHDTRGKVVGIFTSHDALKILSESMAE